MKRLFVVSLLSLGILSACDTAKLSTTSVDDVYAVPSEERARARSLAAEQEKQRALERQAAQEAYSKTQARVRAEDSAIANNPYYRDPQYSADDYYDYAYSARINRFHNPIGVGYYDNYYTNIYSYSQNPLFYGTSIYSGFGMGMPSTYFGVGNSGFGMANSWGWGNSLYYDPFCSYWGGNAWGGGFGFNNGFNNFGGFNNGFHSPWSYDPYGFNSWNMHNNGYWNGFNNGYWHGYNNGFWNGYNNGSWVYLNSFDNNSGYQQMTNAPRQVHTGGTRNDAGQLRADNGGRSYYEQVAQQQQGRQRFSVPREGRVFSDGRGQTDGTQRIGGNNSGGTIINSNASGSGANTRGSQTRSTERQQGRVYAGDRQQGTQMERGSSSQQNTNSGSNQASQRSNSGGNSGSSNTGGGSAPRSSGSGGGGRPR